MTHPRITAVSGMILGLAAGLVVTIPAMMLAVASGGVGHGNYAAARLLYPYSMLLTRFTEDRIAGPSLVLALVQFPLYGFAVGGAIVRPRRLTSVCPVVIGLVAHGLAALACFLGFIPNFS